MKSKSICFSLPKVCLPGLHITLGIFDRLFSLLVDRCHEPDVSVALENSAVAAGGHTYSRYVSALEEVKTLKDEEHRQINKICYLRTNLP